MVFIVMLTEFVRIALAPDALIASQTAKTTSEAKTVFGGDARAWTARVRPHFRDPLRIVLKRYERKA